MFFKAVQSMICNEILALPKMNWNNMGFIGIVVV